MARRKKAPAQPKPEPSIAEQALLDASEGLTEYERYVLRVTKPYVTILGIEYCIDWPALRTGSSFFLKTTATPTQVLLALRGKAGPLWKYLYAHSRREFGYYGVRVWRLSNPRGEPRLSAPESEDQSRSPSYELPPSP